MDLEKIRTCCESLEQDITALRMTERIEYDFYSAMIDAVQTIAAEITAPPKSNGDRIRQMTDEEELLSAIGTGCYRCAYNNGECDSEYGEGCIAGNLEWLRKEADEDAGTD